MAIPRGGGILPKEGIGEPVGGGFVTMANPPSYCANLTDDWSYCSADGRDATFAAGGYFRR